MDSIYHFLVKQLTKTVDNFFPLTSEHFSLCTLHENVGELIVREWPDVNYIPTTRDSNPQSPYDYIHM